MPTILEVLENGAKQVKEAGSLMRLVFVHPSKGAELGDVREIQGIKIIVPKWNELESLAALTGIPARDWRFWDPNNAYFVGDGAIWDAYKNLPDTNLLDGRKQE